METLGNLIDKLSIIKLKQFHSCDSEQLNILLLQEQDFIQEIDCFVKEGKAILFKANKIYDRSKNGFEILNCDGQFASLISNLIETNCELWHIQEKVYDFENVPNEEKNETIKSLSILNLKRHQYIEKIDEIFLKEVSKR